MLTFYEHFTFSLGNSGKWLLFAVHPAPQAWRRWPGMIVKWAGWHGQRCAKGVDLAGVCWRLRPDGPPSKEDERSVFFQSVGDGFESFATVSQLATVSFVTVSQLGNGYFRRFPVRWLLCRFPVRRLLSWRQLVTALQPYSFSQLPTAVRRLWLLTVGDARTLDAGSARDLGAPDSWG